MILGIHCALEQATKTSIDLCFSVPCTEQSYMDPTVMCVRIGTPKELGQG